MSIAAGSPPTHFTTFQSICIRCGKVLYEWNALEWMRKEQRHDWNGSSVGREI